jgi:hypothetical protein
MDSKHSISNILDFYKKSSEIPESVMGMISENIKKIDTNGDNFISYRELNQYEPTNGSEKKLLLDNWNYLSPSDESDGLQQLPIDTCPINHPLKKEQSKRLALIIDSPLTLNPKNEINVNNKIDPGEITVNHASLHEMAIKLDSPCIKTKHLNKTGPLADDIVNQIKKISEENPDKPLVVSSSVGSSALVIKEKDLKSLLPEDFESKNNLSPSSINASNYFKEPYRSGILEEFQRKLVTGNENLIETGQELIQALAIVDILNAHPSGGKYVTAIGNRDDEVDLIRLVEGIKTISSRAEDGKLKPYNSKLSQTAEYVDADEIWISAERNKYDQIIYIRYTNNDPKNLNTVEVPVVDNKLGDSFLGRDFNSVPKASESDLTTLTELEKLIKKQKSTPTELTLEDLKIRNEINRKYATVKNKLIVGPSKLQSYEVYYDDTTQKYEAVIKNYRIDKQGQLYQYYEGSSFAKPMNQIFNDLEAQKNMK